MQHILIVEDEEQLAAILGDYLRASSFAVSWLREGTGAVKWIREQQPDLVLLDLMLPGRDGMEICKDIRTFSSVPIIMITARIEEIDRILGLELGADDYICKPFSPREVVARVKAVLRRSSGTDCSDQHLHLHLHLHLDAGKMQASLHGQPLELTVVEFKLLSLLSAHPGRIFSRDQLMEHMYQDQRIVSDRTIDSHVKKLRRKMETIAPDSSLIRSVYGAGYAFDLQ